MAPSILLPAYLSAISARDTVIACSRILDSDGDVLIDGSRHKFSDPFGLAMLGATLSMVQEAGQAVQVFGLSNDAAGYLCRMDVFRDVELIRCDTHFGQRHDRSGSLVEVTRIEHQRDVDDAAFRLTKSLLGTLPGIDRDETPDPMSGYTPSDLLAEPIQYCLSELLENSLTHARKHGRAHACVWVASQYYASSDTIRVGVVDNGCGFLASLESHPDLRNPTHLEAILAALRPRVSCNRDLRLGLESVNQGIGLTMTSRIARSAKGRMVIVSGDAVCDSQSRSCTIGSCEYWDGVAIGMAFQRGELPHIRLQELLPPIEHPTPVKLRFE